MPRHVPILLAAITLWPAAGLHAQVPYEGCTTRSGQPIVGIVSNDESYAAWATTRSDGTPVIYWNPRRQYSPQGVTQVFLYLHECAHHALGHLWRRASSLEARKQMEIEADCWAYQLMVDGGMLTGNRRAALESDIRYSTGDATHLAGEAGLRSLAACLEARTSKKAWHAVLPQLEQAATDSFSTLRAEWIPEAPGFSLAALQVPGTYDCEVRSNGSYVCLIFAARDDRRVARRFDAVARIIRDWLTPPWTSTEAADTQPGYRRMFVAERADNGTRITLLATADRKIWFVMRGGGAGE